MLESPQTLSSLLQPYPHCHLLQRCPEGQEHFNRNTFSSQAVEWASTKTVHHRISLEAALCTLNSEAGLCCGVSQLTLPFHSCGYLQWMGRRESKKALFQKCFSKVVSSEHRGLSPLLTQTDRNQLPLSMVAASDLAQSFFKSSENVLRYFQHHQDSFISFPGGKN